MEHAEGKKLVIESAVIPEYLDDIFPETKILPSDPYEKVQQKLLLERLSDQLTPAFGRVFRAIKNPEELKEKFESILKAFEEAESLLEGAFYSGKKFNLNQIPSKSTNIFQEHLHLASSTT